MRRCLACADRVGHDPNGEAYQARFPVRQSRPEHLSPSFAFQVWQRSHWLRGIEPKKSPAKKILAGLVREGSGDPRGAAPVVPGRPFTFDPGAAHDSPAYAAPWIISCACCVRGYDAARRVAAEVYPKISNPREIEPSDDYRDRKRLGVGASGVIRIAAPPLTNCALALIVL